MRDGEEIGTWKILRSVKVVKPRWVAQRELWWVLEWIIGHPSRVEFVRDWQRSRISAGDQKRNRSWSFTTGWRRPSRASTGLSSVSCIVNIRWFLRNLTTDQLGTESFRLFSERKTYLDHRQKGDDHHSMQHRIRSTNSDTSIYLRFSCLRK